MYLTARDAIARHMQWRITLQTAVHLREAVSNDQLEMIRNHRLCLIGRWLAAPETAASRSGPVLQQMISRHIGFHKEMQHVAQLLSVGRFEQAETALLEGSAFSIAGKNLALAITSLDLQLPVLIPMPAGFV